MACVYLVKRVVRQRVCMAVSHLGIRSCDRDANLANALMSVVMTLGAGQTAPLGGDDEVISNNTASSTSKQEVMSSTEQRESHDADRYSPRTHTWKPNKWKISSASAWKMNCERVLNGIQNTQNGNILILETARAAASLPHGCRFLLCCRRRSWLQRTPAARETGPPPGRGGAYTASAGGSWTPYRGRREREGSSEWGRHADETQQSDTWSSSVCVNLCISFVYLGMLRRRLLLSRMTRIKWAKSCSSAT